MSKKTLVIVADGFEEIETIAIIDILRRANISIVTASLTSLSVKGAHNIKIEVDCLLSQVDLKYFSSVIIPGGVKSVDSLKANSDVCDIINSIYREEGTVAAICAGPFVLGKAGVLAGKKMTSYPTFKEEFSNSIWLDDMVVVDGRIITGQGVGCSIDFALTVAEELGTDLKPLKEKMLL